MIEKTKGAITSAFLVATVLAPTALHYSATGYLRFEQYVGGVLFGWKLKALRAVGLQPVVSEATIDDLIDRAADRYGIKRPLLHALAVTESKKDPTAVSHKGAIGVLQVMPGNAKRCGLAHHGKLWDETANIECGARILSEELATYKGNIPNALRAYNGGPRAVGGKFPESEAYVVKVMSNVGKEILR